MLKTASTLDEITAAWKARKQNQPPDFLTASIQTIQFLATGQPLSLERFRAINSLTNEQTKVYFDQLKAAGCEFNSQGQLVGNALSLTPSPYQMQINGQTLFAWCALDTLFLPACVGQTAQVTSICYVTNTPITLMVRPEGVESIDPSTTVLSIVIPRVTPSCNLKAKTGPQGPICSFLVQRKWLSPG